MLPLLLTALCSAAQVESVLIPGTTVYFDLVEIPATKHSRAFRIGRTEVTWAEYNLYADSFADEKIDGITRPSQPDVVNPRDPFPDGTVQTGRHPARSIGMYGALGYCDWLTWRTGRRFRLPTEPEWQAAAGRAIPANHGRHLGNSGGHTHPVGSLPATPTGIHDLLGNVAELCLEPHAAAGGPGVVRGGSWKTPGERLRPTLRERIDLDAWQEDDPKRPIRDWWFTDAPFVGFRVVASDPDIVSDEARADAHEARMDAIHRIAVEDVRVDNSGTAPGWIARISGRLRSLEGPDLEEVELASCFTAPDGTLIRVDPRGKPAWGTAWPVLASTAHRDGREKPLKPGVARKFTVLVPRPFDEVGPMPVGKPVVKVTWVRLAR